MLIMIHGPKTVTEYVTSHDTLNTLPLKIKNLIVNDIQLFRTSTDQFYVALSTLYKNQLHLVQYVQFSPQEHLSMHNVNFITFYELTIFLKHQIYLDYVINLTA